MVNKYFKALLITAIVTTAFSCNKNADDGQVTGKYVDEFGNKFELREDHSATIQFDGQDKVNDTRWHNGARNDTSYITIEYNGDSTYYYMSHGKLYRRIEDLKAGHPAIELERD